MNQDFFKLVTDYPITEYRCGARAGDKVRLKENLVVKDHRGNPIHTHPRGEVWTVRRGAVEKPVVVWLEQANGETHTWSDDEDFWHTFEILPRSENR